MSPDAEGFGDLAITNTYRQRFPVFRYLVGDVGRLVEQDGERLLQLRGRNARSFLLAEQHFELDQIAPLAAGAEAFQIQLRRDGHGDESLELLLVDPAGQCAPAHVATGLARLIGEMAPRTTLDVRRIAMAMLYQDPATAKVPPIADFRR